MKSGRHLQRNRYEWVFIWWALLFIISYVCTIIVWVFFANREQLMWKISVAFQIVHQNCLEAIRIYVWQIKAKWQFLFGIQKFNRNIAFLHQSRLSNFTIAWLNNHDSKSIILMKFQHQLIISVNQIGQK